jgi:hypothetical protein
VLHRISTLAIRFLTSSSSFGERHRRAVQLHLQGWFPGRSRISTPKHALGESHPRLLCFRLFPHGAGARLCRMTRVRKGSGRCHRTVVRHIPEFGIAPYAECGIVGTHSLGRTATAAERRCTGFILPRPSSPALTVESPCLNQLAAVRPVPRGCSSRRELMVRFGPSAGIEDETRTSAWYYQRWAKGKAQHARGERHSATRSSLIADYLLAPPWSTSEPRGTPISAIIMPQPRLPIRSASIEQRTSSPTRASVLSNLTVRRRARIAGTRSLCDGGAGAPDVVCGSGLNTGSGECASEAHNWNVGHQV